ncbi:precorrin-2 dehydrogenase/sirohydrochlorin ferrochelatase family protein [Heliorestis convoluta]|uniref:precorrin-2 dehydrogenase n=1 Tax=Heliorestis convoluta TaxID=356322 RepID=A0A5Q2N2E5_9FIRM|nr:bifunctional precorrin-2 dehydrogenase/sirohydrochlorin ferrochelatase [Heliorestis convoluta]QGG47766.1 bifunctional precorrin-2 dehydrogenase/sirohydrochlorin ferrochelatase [Heliorestis convoluta]
MLYPIILKLESRPCLVVGGGKVAERKVNSLVDAGAKVAVISPMITENIQKWVDQGTVRYQGRGYQEGDAAGYFLVVAATDLQEVNDLVTRDCNQRNILINTVDNPEGSNFYVPATIRRGDLQIAISTGGASPAVARRIRQSLEVQFGEEYGEFLTLMARLREQVLREVPCPVRRKAIFDSLADADLLELIKCGEEKRLKERVAQCLSSSLD